MFSPRVKHGADNHISRRDGTFTDSENETNDEEAGKILASRMATQSYTPDKYIDAREVSLQKMELHAKHVRLTSSIFRRETVAAPNSGGSRRRDIQDRRSFLT